jgi:hypothetical protein
VLRVTVAVGLLGVAKKMRLLAAADDDLQASMSWPRGDGMRFRLRQSS